MIEVRDGERVYRIWYSEMLKRWLMAQLEFGVGFMTTVHDVNERDPFILRAASEVRYLK